MSFDLFSHLDLKFSLLKSFHIFPLTDLLEQTKQVYPEGLKCNLSEYCHASGAQRSSYEYASSISSTSRTSPKKEQSSYECSSFRRELSSGTLSEFTSKLWIPDFKEIRNSLFSSGGKFAEEVWILETLAVRVTTVRGFFEWLREVREEKHIDEGTEFQPVMHKLLENITGIAYRSPHFTVFDAQQTLLEGILEVKYDDGTI
jgi:hypothetical protein